jgi:multicomponent Na+:H+ antiporter subunit B
MTRRARARLFVAAAVGLAALLVWGLVGLPEFGVYLGPYGDVIAQVAVPERQGTELVGDVTFDYRGFDTLGEIFIVFAAASGVSLLLRAQRDEQEEAARAEEAERRGRLTSDLLRAFGVAMVGPTVLVGMYELITGQLTPGGGFQGGVLLASALLLVFVAGQYFAVRAVRPIPLVELADGVGSAAFVLIGVGGLVFGAAFLENFLPLGKAGDLISAGTVQVLNFAAGIEVTASFTLILSEFLDQVVLTRMERR